MSTELTIITNKHYRPLLDWCELSKKDRAYFDWDGAEEDTYFKYKGVTYALGEFMRSTAFDAWDGVHGDSYFSGVLVKVHPYGDGVMVGRYYC
jgi:asparagine N-glycosylation enzyme membrane subunit Stt3